jgi:hypothetical protein
MIQNSWSSGKRWQRRGAEFSSLWTGFYSRKIGYVYGVPDDDELKRDILAEAHQTSYTIHPISMKMY